MTVDYNARYSDGYAYKVIYDPTERKTYLATSDGGRMDVPFYLNGAHFVEFYFTGFDGMMGKDAWAARAQMDRLLTAPTKPADPPKTEPEDTRLHLGERLSNEDPLQHLQRVHAEQEIAAQRKARQQARNQAQSATVDPRTAQQAQQARQERNEIAALKKR